MNGVDSYMCVLPQVQFSGETFCRLTLGSFGLDCELKASNLQICSYQSIINQHNHPYVVFTFEVFRTSRSFNSTLNLHVNEVLVQYKVNIEFIMIVLLPEWLILCSTLSLTTSP